MGSPQAAQAYWFSPALTIMTFLRISLRECLSPKFKLGAGFIAG